MASLGFGSAESAVTMRNAVFRMMLARAASQLDDPADRDELEMAEAFGGLAFDQLDPDRRGRIALAVRTGLQQLKREAAAGTDLEEPVHPDIDEKLDELIAFMDRQLGTNPSSSE